jgi:hypothetical protein
MKNLQFKRLFPSKNISNQIAAKFKFQQITAKILTTSKN